MTAIFAANNDDKYNIISISSSSIPSITKIHPKRFIPPTVTPTNENGITFISTASGSGGNESSGRCFTLESLQFLRDSLLSPNGLSMTRTETTTTSVSHSHSHDNLSTVRTSRSHHHHRRQHALTHFDVHSILSPPPHLASSSRQNRRQIFGSYWDAIATLVKTTAAIISSNATTRQRQDVTEFPSLQGHPRSIGLPDVSSSNDLSDDDHRNGTGSYKSPSSSTYNSRQRLARKYFRGVNPFVQPKSILRTRRCDRSQRTDDGNIDSSSSSLNDDDWSSSRSGSLCNDANDNFSTIGSCIDDLKIGCKAFAIDASTEKSSDGSTTTATSTDCDRSRSSSISSTSYSSADSSSSNHSISTDTNTITTDRSTIVVQFDPRITITEFVKRHDDDRRLLWYTEMELHQFQDDTIRRVQEYFDKHPDERWYYRQQWYDPTTKKMRSRALFAIPVYDLCIS